MFDKMVLIQYPTSKWGFVGKVHESLNDKTFGTEKAARLAAEFAKRFGAEEINQIVRN